MMETGIRLSGQPGGRVPSSATVPVFFMAMQDFSKVPLAIRERPQWVLWKTACRHGEKPTKLPYQLDGTLAKSDDPTTWSRFDAACRHLRGYSGIGYVFAADDPYCGVDLDGCRDPETGRVAEWAKAIIRKLDTYAEVSPSQSGIKLWCRARWPLPSGKKLQLPNAERVCDREPAIEVYDHKRYFAVTSRRLVGPHEPEERQEIINWLRATYWPVREATDAPRRSCSAPLVDRARKYVARLPEAISGQGGHNRTFRAACVLVLGFGLDEDAALAVLDEFNARCKPPWTEGDLLRKVREAAKQPGPRGYLISTMAA
jgi:hypothetical protein